MEISVQTSPEPTPHGLLPLQYAVQMPSPMLAVFSWTHVRPSLQEAVPILFVQAAPSRPFEKLGKQENWGWQVSSVQLASVEQVQALTVQVVPEVH